MMEVKKEMIKKLEQGMRVPDITKLYNDLHNIEEERGNKGDRCCKRSHKSIKAIATSSGRCKKVTSGVDKREATSR